MIDAYKKFWKGYVDFTGRSTRPEYWWPILCHFLVMILILCTALLIETVLNSETGGSLSTAFAGLMVIYYIAILLPSLAIQVRRLRDGGYHWALLFLYLVPFFGHFILFIFYCQPTKYELVSNDSYNNTEYQDQQFSQNPYQEQQNYQQNFVATENE